MDTEESQVYPELEKLDSEMGEEANVEHGLGDRRPRRSDPHPNAGPEHRSARTHHDDRERHVDASTRSAETGAASWLDSHSSS
jgi:hypothetical protein